MPILPARLNALLIFSILLVFFSFCLALPQISLAASSFLVVTPAEIEINTAFEIDLNISATPNTSYNVKARLGNATNKLTQGQTLADDNTTWLTDNDSWTKFPVFTTDINGNWVGKISVRSVTTAQTGPNYLTIRIHTGNSSIDSSTYSLDLKEAPVTPPTPQPAPQPVPEGKPILSEFMPQPSNGKEWVEIKNQGNTTADISGWFIDDEPGKSSPSQIPTGTIIAPGSFYVLTFTSSKLNDVTDMVRLLKPDEGEVESYRYDHTEKGSSWSKDNSGNWFLTTSITPGGENASPPQAQTSPNVQSKTTTDSQTADLTNTSTNLDQAPVLASATYSASTNKLSATVSAANFSKIPKKPGNIFTLPLFILGFLSLALAALSLIKQKLQASVPAASIESVKMGS